MVKIIIQQLLLFLVPIAIYVAYALWQRHRARRSGKAVAGLEEGPWFWLIVGGLALSLAGFVVLGFSTGEGMGGFVPAHIENGRIVPAQPK